MNVINWILSNWAALLGYVTLGLHVLIAFFMIIPGPEPERTLQKILDWLTSISRK